MFDEVRYWLVTDIHKNHLNILKYCNRPPNFMDILIKNWCMLIKPTDVVIDLGDVIFHNSSELTGFLMSVPGTKILVRGNHDKHNSDSWFINHGFSFVCDQLVIGDTLITHKPVVVPDNIRLNLHGHIHNVPPANWEKPLVDILCDKHRLLSLEKVNYRPVLLRECQSEKHVIRTKAFYETQGKQGTSVFVKE